MDVIKIAKIHATVKLVLGSHPHKWPLNTGYTSKTFGNLVYSLYQKALTKSLSWLIKELQW